MYISPLQMWTTATMITTLTAVLSSLLLCVFHLDDGDAASLSAKFKVNGLDTIRAGQMTRLHCYLEGTDTGAVTPPPSYVWVKDGKVIPGQTESNIRFPSATRQDAGFYQCGVPGSDVSGEGRRLHVVVPGDILPKPNIEYKVLPVCGRPYSLHCTISQQYIPSDDTRYTWYKDYTEVESQPAQTLTFTNVTEADEGNYTCTAREGPVETTSPPSNEFYLRPLVIPQVTIEPNSTDSVVKGILGGKLTLTCKVTRAFPWVPSDSYSWSYFSSPNGEQRPLVERTNNLTLGPLTREDSGQYVCQARNDQGLVSLNLIGHASVTVDVVYLESIALTPDLEINEGDHVTFTCQVDSHPTARLAWTVNGQEVRHVTYNVDHYVIPSAVCSDSNNYTCRASNTDMPGLERNATVQLHVICKQASTEPHTTTTVFPTEPHTSTTVFPTELQPEQSVAGLGLHKVHVEGRGRSLQGTPYSLDCVITPASASNTTSAFVWRRDSKLLDHHTGPVLPFTRLSKLDEGIYQCGLDSGDTERNHLSGPYFLRVTVFENITLGPEVEVEEGQTAILNCSVLSDPTAYLTWRLDGKDVRVVRSNSDSLVLHNASRLHLAVVQCQAYNEALVMGFMTAYSLIRIKGTYEIVPRPWLGPRGVPVLHRRFGMECLVMDIPNLGVNVHLTYTWYKDDKEIEGQAGIILEFPSMTREDTGVYTCTARNGKVQTTSLQSNELDVVVLVPPVVHIEPKTPDNIVKHAAGQNLTLTCKVTQALPGVATDGYRWSYLPSPQGQLRPLEGRESTLTLGPLTREDSGQYFCQAWNYEDFGGLLPPGNASVTLDVLYLGNVSLTSDLKVNESDHVTLTCSVDCNPAARLAWVVDGLEVRHVTAKVDHYVLQRAACSDSKTYTCRASNPDLPGLERTASTQVLVNCTEEDGVAVTTESPDIVNQPNAAGRSSMITTIVLSSVLPSTAAVVLVVLVIYFVRKRQTMKRPQTEAGSNDVEKQPLDRPSPASSCVSSDAIT